MRISITRICYRRWERCEIGNWLMHCAVQWLTDPAFGGCRLNAGVVDYSPVEAARNLAVRRAQERGTDLLVLCDDDMDPHRDFLKLAVQTLKDRPDAVLGSPARGARPECPVNVSEYLGGELVRVANTDAAGRQGVEKVHCMGAGLIAIPLSALALLHPPYFRTHYTDETCSQASTTEDMHFTRSLTAAGGDVLCAWDCWSAHAKTELLGKPSPEELEGGVSRLMVNTHGTEGREG